MTKRNERGMSAVGVIVIILVVVGVGGAAVYFLSDPWRSRMDAAYDNFAQWTPENIAKDPKSYLNFCQQQANNALQSLKAAEIRIAQHKAKISGQKEAAAKRIEAGEPVLDELKQLYKDTAAGGAWPVTYRETEFDEPAMKKQIIKLYNEIQGQKEIVDSADKGLKALEVQATKVDEQRDACNEQLRLIEVNRSKLEIEQITEELKTQLVSMKGVIETAVEVGSDASDTFSLESLVDQSATTIDEAKFESILNQ